jgi:uncharacterized protein GlcG (DUF336 family)
VALAAAGLMHGAGACAQAPAPRWAPVLSEGLARQMTAAALAGCRHDGFAVSVAIVDPAGMLRDLATDDAVRPIDIDSARLKAVAAATLDAPSGAIGRQAQAVPAFGKVLAQLRPGLLLADGGLPIRAHGVLIGGLGVGGAPRPEADERCAAAGLAAVAEQLK